MTPEMIFQTTGFSIFVTGLLTTLLAAVWIFRNFLAGMVWGVSVLILLFASLFDVSLEAFWLANVGTVALLVAGMAVRARA